ncbi:MAG: type II secretion system minor pseudopilin GspK [Pseudomonadota bacterium]
MTVRDYPETKVRRRAERGTVLLSVLLLIVVMSGITVALSDGLRFGIRRAINQQTLAQADYYARGAEALAREAIWLSWNQQPQRSTLLDQWARAPQDFLIPGGRIRGVVRDGGNCFNINSLVRLGEGGLFRAEEEAALILARLYTLLGFGEVQANALVDNLIDWLDSDQSPRPRGTEDFGYSRRNPPYRTASGLMGDVSELRSVAGYTPQILIQVLPFLCAVPTPAPTRININTLLAGDAILLAMLFGEQDDFRGLDIGDAESLIETRPLEGFKGIEEILNESVFRDLEADGRPVEYLDVRTSLYEVVIEVEYEGLESRYEALIELSGSGELNRLSSQFGDDF